MPRKETLISTDQDRSALGSLYPEPKSLEARRADEQKRIDRQAKKLPRFPQLVLPFFGSIVLGLAFFYMMNLSTMWQDGNVSLIFFSFGLWLALCALAVLWIKKVNSTFYAFGKTAAPFWIGFVVILAVITVLFVTGWRAGIDRLELSAGLAGISFIMQAVYITALFMMMRKRK